MQLKTTTFIATPTYRGEVDMRYAHSLCRDILLATANGHFCEPPYMVAHTLIHLARWDCMLKFKASQADYLFFIDQDTGWSIDALGDMLDMPTHLDIVAGICRRRAEPVVYPFNALAGVPIEFPMCEIEGAGACFMRITRSAVERTIARFPGANLFDVLVAPQYAHYQPIGEDMSFCLRAREAGCRIWGKFDIRFQHVGPHSYEGMAMEDMADRAGSVRPARKEAA